MFDSKPKVTPPPSPPSSPRLLTLPYSRTRSPTSFAARKSIRVTVVILLLITIISVTNQLRCARHDCLTRDDSHESSWVAGGSVIPERFRQSFKSQHPESIATKETQQYTGPPQETKQDIDEGNGEARTWEESSLVNPANQEGPPSSDVEPGKQGNSARPTDIQTDTKLSMAEDLAAQNPHILALPPASPPPNTYPREGTPDLEAHRLTIPHAFPLPKTNAREQELNDGNGPMWSAHKHIPLSRETEVGYFKPGAGANGVKEHATWEEGQGQEDPVRVSVHGDSGEAGMEGRLVANVGGGVANGGQRGDKSVSRFWSVGVGEYRGDGPGKVTTPVFVF